MANECRNVHHTSPNTETLTFCRFCLTLLSSYEYVVISDETTSH